MNPRVFFYNPPRARTRARTAKQEERLWSLAMKNPSCINYRRQHVHKTRDGNKFAVTGTLSTGSLLFTIDVPDINKVSQYSATIQQVAASSNFALRSLTNYALSVTK